MRNDARIPLRFGGLETRRPDEAVLTDGPAAIEGAVARFDAGLHRLGCACCGGSSAAGAALAGLYRERAVGKGPAFGSVLAVVGPAGESAIRAALEGELVAMVRFRLA